MELQFIVNGTPTIVTAKKTDYLLDTKVKALKQSQNWGRPLTDWELKDKDGKAMDEMRKVSTVDTSSELWLSLRAGYGG